MQFLAGKDSSGHEYLACLEYAIQHSAKPVPSADKKEGAVRMGILHVREKRLKSDASEFKPTKKRMPARTSPEKKDT